MGEAERQGGGGRGGGESSCILLTVKGIGPGTIIFVFILCLLCFIVGQGNGTTKKLFCFMGGGMRGKETEQLFFVSYCPLKF